MKYFLVAFQITLSMISTYAYATKMTLVHQSGQKEIIESGFSQDELEKNYKLVKKDQLLAVILEDKINGKNRILHISSVEFLRVSALLNNWISAENFLIKPLPTTLVNENAHYVHPVQKLNKFFITNSLKKNPILYTDGICECVVVIGHNPSTKKGFLGHYSFWIEGHLKEELMAAISKINEGAASDDDMTVNVRLVTHQASNFSKKVLETVRELGIEPKINFNPGALQLSEWNQQTNFKLIKDFIDPKGITFSDVLEKFIITSGRSIYFDSRDGQIYEQLP